MKSNVNIPQCPNILVVDDTPANLQLLTGLLTSRGYKVRPVPSGELALQAAQREAPQLILLDINMPGMDGYKVCERLKANPDLAEIPIIFISALNETLDKVKGFMLGAVDYVTKPFQFEEVEARVRTHLELARLRIELKQHNEQLDTIVKHRTQELADAKARLAILDKAKSDFLLLISHELRTPLSGILGVADILLESSSENPGTAKYREIYELSRNRLMSLIDDALLLTQISAGEDFSLRHECSLDAILERACQQASSIACFHGVHLGALPGNCGKILGEDEFLTRAIQSLVETSIKLSAKDTQVAFSQESHPGSVCLKIDSGGHTIPPDTVARFFDLLSNAKPITPGGDLGLSPALAERIITLFGGKVTVNNLVPPGVRLSVSLKTPQPN